MCAQTNLFEMAVEDIMDEVGANLLKNSPEYRNLAEQSIEISQKLLRVLPQEMKSVLDEFENTQFRMQDIAMSSIYKLGLANGVSLQAEVKKIFPEMSPSSEKRTSDV